MARPPSVRPAVLARASLQWPCAAPSLSCGPPRALAPCSQALSTWRSQAGSTPALSNTATRRFQRLLQGLLHCMARGASHTGVLRDPKEPVAAVSQHARSRQQHSQPAVERSPASLHVPLQPPGTSYRLPEEQARLPSQLGLPAVRSAPERSEFAVVEGTVKTITLQNKSTGYMVAKIKVAPGEVRSDRLQRNGVVTAVATNKELLLGQRVKLEGRWTKHQKYGMQLQVDSMTHYQMGARESMVAMLQGAALPGVGPVTATRLASHFGKDLPAIMDSPDAAARICSVKGIGAKTSKAIKEAWDNTKGRREAAAFLQNLGLQGRVVQRILVRHGDRAKEAVSKDPFYALRNIKGINLRTAETIAERLGLDLQQPSRGIMALCDVLLEAARQSGHTFLTWGQLQQQALHHINASGKSWKTSDLSGIAQLAASWGDIVVELGEVEAPPPVTAAEGGLSEVEASLHAYLCRRLPGVGPKRADSLLAQFGSRVPDVLSSENAVEQLGAVPKLLPHVCLEIKRHWEATADRFSPWRSPRPDLELPPLRERLLQVESAKQPTIQGEAWTAAVRCYHPELHAAETVVAKELARLAARRPVSIRGTKDPIGKINAWITRNESTTGVVLSEGQKAAVRAASTAPVLILTGGPGCGKTYTTATIVKLWSAMQKEVKLAAPTGRASQRLQEMAGLPSSTIHRLLQYKAGSPYRMDGSGADDEELEGSYAYGPSNRLPAEAVLVDEAAMLDVSLAAALLAALPTQCQLVLVGDVDQLPPVGPGTVLSAAIESGTIPVIDLREIFRQAEESAIVTAAHNVQAGKFPDLSPLPANELEVPYRGPELSDAVWVKPEGPADGKALQSLVKKVLRNYVHPLGYRPVTDVQVLAPLRRGTSGVEALNSQLQQLVNPARQEVEEVSRAPGSRSGAPVFRLGDRVIQTINNYEREVFNGDPGFVVDVRPADRTVTVKFPETDFHRLSQGHRTKEVEYRASSLWELDLAWATTVHKAQGGECPVVVLMLSNAHKPLLTRRLLYTALTRAKQLVVVVGPERALQTAVKEVKGDERLSSLMPRLRAQAARLGVQLRAAQQFGARRTIRSVEVPCTSQDAVPEAVAEIASSNEGYEAAELAPGTAAEPPHNRPAAEHPTNRRGGSSAPTSPAREQLGQRATDLHSGRPGYQHTAPQGQQHETGVVSLPPSAAAGRPQGHSPLPEGYSWSEWEAEVGRAASLPEGRSQGAQQLPRAGAGAAQRRSQQPADRVSGNQRRWTSQSQSLLEALQAVSQS